MNKIIQIKIFNEKLTHFLQFLEDAFPDFKSDFFMAKNAIALLKSTNPRMVPQEFMKYISPFKNNIYNCDEDFFLNFEKNIKLDSDNILFGMKLKAIWEKESTTDQNKAIVFYYFQELIKIGEKCF